VAGDQRTKDAMLRALPLLAGERITGLMGKRLEAEDFDRLAVGDSVRDLLLWMSDPGGYESRCEGAKWATFCNVCKSEYHFDPVENGVMRAGDLLLTGGGAWERVWERFCEAPTLYAGLVQVLRESTPQDLTVEPNRQPRVNLEQEDELRIALQSAAGLPHEQACAQVLELESKHGSRRNWIWAQLGDSPLAMLLEPLSRVARHAMEPIGNATVADAAAKYASDAWRCDEAALDALSAASSAETMLVNNVLKAIYVPWLENGARVFQEMVLREASALRSIVSGVPSEPETCILFADGLRFDLGQKLLAVLESRGVSVTLSHRIAPTPSVTATGKPMASPAHTTCGESEQNEDLAPLLGGKTCNAQRLRDEIAGQGIAVLASDETSFPPQSKQGGWTEYGKIDSKGHSLGLELASVTKQEIESLADRIQNLLDAGWSRVRIVTDHGWILVPMGMPKVALPSFLTDMKWSRCAVVQGKPPKGLVVLPWHWNSNVMIASPPGIGSFFANTDYAHGGVSLQELVVPELIAMRGTETVRAHMTNVAWRGMRCRVHVETNVAHARIDLRLRARDAQSSVLENTKDIGPDGEVSVVVSDEHEGKAVIVVIVDVNDQILDQKPTQVGEET